jgi:hypothetical protein
MAPTAEQVVHVAELGIDSLELVHDLRRREPGTAPPHDLGGRKAVLDV